MRDLCHCNYFSVCRGGVSVRDLYISIPCKTGSPLLNFQSHLQETEIRTVVMAASGFYLALGDQASFELPKRNQIWDRELTGQTLEQNVLIFSGTVKLCRTGLIGKDRLPSGEQLRFVSTPGAFAMSLERKFGQCECTACSFECNSFRQRGAVFTSFSAWSSKCHVMKGGFKESRKTK